MADRAGDKPPPKKKQRCEDPEIEENATGLEDQNDTTKVALIACDMGFVACPGNQWMV